MRVIQTSMESDADGAVSISLTDWDAFVLLAELSYVDGALRSTPLPPLLASLLASLIGELDPTRGRLPQPARRTDGVILAELGGLSDEHVSEAASLGIATLAQWRQVNKRQPEEWRSEGLEPPSLSLRNRLDDIADALRSVVG